MTLFEEATQFALNAHAGTMRKKENIPYILHPMEVATIAATMSQDEALLAAAVLHDTVEDTATTAEQIEENFGPRVAALVASETEDKHEGTSLTDSWLIRKKESIAILENTDDIEIKMLWLSDKLSNMRSFYRLWKLQGKNMWDGFHQTDPKMQAWYYRTIRDVVSDLKDFDAWKEFSDLTDQIFSEV